MKHFLLLLFLLTCCHPLFAQSEVHSDTLRNMSLPQTKDFGGFLLDMNLMKMAAPKLPSSKLEIPDASKDYGFIFQLDPNKTYSQGFSNVFNPSVGSVYSLNPFGLTGFGGSSQYLQMGSFKLKNGMQLNTYGDYNADGRRVFNPSALPWERNNFRGAFELKSANGNFGIKIEVQQERGFPY